MEIVGFKLLEVDVGTWVRCRRREVLGCDGDSGGDWHGNEHGGGDGDGNGDGDRGGGDGDDTLVRSNP